jgi:UDP-galactose transporter
LYLVQNNLQYLAVSYLQAATYQVTYQLKILSTALLSVLILGKQLGMQQWGALSLLTFGVILVQLSEMSNSSGNSESSNLSLGLTFTLAATLSSGMAGVYFEKILKGGSTLDLWQRNLQLGLYSIVIGMVGLVTTGQWDKVTADGFFQGYTTTTFASVALQGLGGLLIAIVIKYTDNIMKNIATSMSIVVSAVVSIFLFDTPLTLLFLTGAMLVNFAAYWYSR